MTISVNVLNAIRDLRPAYFPNAFDKLFTWQDLENLLNLRPFVNRQRLKILKRGVSYDWPMQTWMSDINCYPPTLLEQIIREHHAYFIDASRVNQRINDVCKELEETIKGCADAHIFFNLSDEGKHGFGIHWDFSHNLIVQMEGETRMQIWNDKVSGVSNVSMLQESPMIDVIMRTGDAVFIPMKIYHCVTSLSKRLSVSFPVSLDDTTPSQERYWIKI